MIIKQILCPGFVRGNIYSVCNWATLASEQISNNPEMCCCFFVSLDILYPKQWIPRFLQTHPNVQLSEIFCKDHHCRSLTGISNRSIETHIYSNYKQCGITIVNIITNIKYPTQAKCNEFLYGVPSTSMRIESKKVLWLLLVDAVVGKLP